MKWREVLFLFFSDLKHPYFWARSIVCFVVILGGAIIGNYADLSAFLQFPDYISVEYIFLYLSQTGFLLPLSLISASYLSAISFCRDRSSRFLISILFRITRKSYLIGRIFECAIFSLLSIVIPSTISFLCLSSKILNCNYLYCVIIIANYAVAVSFWCLCGLLISTWITNEYVVTIAPFVLSYVIGRICYSILPVWFNPNEYMQSYILSYASPKNQWIVILWGYLEFLILSVIVSVLFFKRANMVLENET